MAYEVTRDLPLEEVEIGDAHPKMHLPCDFGAHDSGCALCSGLAWVW